MICPSLPAWSRRAAPLAVITALTGCVDKPSPAIPLLNAFYAKTDRTLDNDTQLSRAAFPFVQGQSQPEAIRTMQALGFACDGATCLYESVERESGFEKHVGMRMRRDTEPKYQRRVHARRFTVTFHADQITAPDDIVGRFEYASGTTPWYRPIKDSGLP